MAKETKYGAVFEDGDISEYLSSLKNKVYKLLPLREEGLDWKKFLNSVLNEMAGFTELFDNKVSLLLVMSKLECLYELEDFMTYRKMIFECLNGIDDLR